MVNFQIVSLKVPPVKHQKFTEGRGMFGYRYRKVSTDGEGMLKYLDYSFETDGFGF
jgi:hypothetical protein